MSTPMTATQIVAQLKKWGIKYVEMSGWKTHNRNHKGAWGPVNGFIWHHTGSDGPGQQSFLYNGSTALPGPLCHFGLAPDGTVYLVGWGRANHAGGGDPAVFAKVKSEDYSGTLKPTKGNSDGYVGNANFYGVEIMYDGGQPMSDAQYKTALKLSAAICEFHGWTEKSCIAHGEWSQDKWDPGRGGGKMMDMVKVRSDIKTTLAGKTTPTTPPSKPAPTNPAPAPSSTYTVKSGDTLYSVAKRHEVSVADLKKWNGLKSDTLSLGQVLKVKAPTPSTGGATVAKKDATYKSVWDLDAATPPKGHETKENPTWAPMSILKGIYEGLEALRKEVAALAKAVDELKTK